jgi:hypothetical protein
MSDRTRSTETTNKQITNLLKISLVSIARLIKYNNARRASRSNRALNRDNSCLAAELAI